MAQLAEVSFAADPAALRAAAPDALTTGNADPSVQPPDYEQFENDFYDAERATLISALSSKSTGVGGSFDQDVFLDSSISSGPAPGSFSPDSMIALVRRRPL